MNPSALLVVLVAFVLMEPVTAATHRFVMHGVGEWLHRSHHRPGDSGWELNDWYPVVFASIVMLGLWAGFNLDGLDVLIPVGIGITLYGAAYALVHDGYIHRRIGWFAGRGLAGRRFAGRGFVVHRVVDRRFTVLDRLAEAHRIHHLYNAAPYGMLLPVVPRALRDRATNTDRDPFATAGGLREPVC